MPNGTSDLVQVSLRLPRVLLEALDAAALTLDPASPNRSSVVRAALTRQLAASSGDRSERPSKSTRKREVAA